MMKVVVLMLLLAIELGCCQHAQNEFILDFANVQDPELLIEEIKNLAQSLHSCGDADVPRLRLQWLSDPDVRCNDGSPAGYYVRRSQGSRRWLVFLEGGWYCYDSNSCMVRWRRMRSFMTSESWSYNRTGSGILSGNPEENPDWWNANTVLIPYCSSDLWTGRSDAGDNDLPFSFHGSKILRSVIRELLPMGLYDADTLLLAGSSAGGLGVMLNLDDIARELGELGASVDVRGLIDSGWYLDNPQYNPAECVEVFSCPPREVVMDGIQIWDSVMPVECMARFSVDEYWRCFFSHEIYQTLSTPVFVVQLLYDEAQMLLDNVGIPVSTSHWRYIQRIGRQLRESLSNVSAVYAPACISHTYITKPEVFKSADVNGVTLPAAIECWMSADQYPADVTRYRRRRSPSARRRGGRVRRDPVGVSDNDQTTWDESNIDQLMMDADTLITSHSETSAVEATCTQHAIDQCNWPQCNPACPNLKNPFTGEEIELVQLLTQLGFDLGSLARQIGVSPMMLATIEPHLILQMLLST